MIHGYIKLNNLILEENSKIEIKTDTSSVIYQELIEDLNKYFSISISKTNITVNVNNNIYEHVFETDINDNPVVIEIYKDKLLLNGKKVFSYNYNNPDSNFFIIGKNGFTGSVYYIKKYDNNILKNYYYPTKLKDGSSGLVEIISGSYDYVWHGLEFDEDYNSRLKKYLCVSENPKDVFVIQNPENNYDLFSKYKHYKKTPYVEDEYGKEYIGDAEEFYEIIPNTENDCDCGAIVPTVIKDDKFTTIINQCNDEVLMTNVPDDYGDSKYIYAKFDGKSYFETPIKFPSNGMVIADVFIDETPTNTQVPVGTQVYLYEQDGWSSYRENNSFGIYFSGDKILRLHFGNDIIHSYSTSNHSTYQISMSVFVRTDNTRLINRSIKENDILVLKSYTPALTVDWWGIDSNVWIGALHDKNQRVSSPTSYFTQYIKSVKFVNPYNTNDVWADYEFVEKDGVVQMHDKVTNRYITNSGTGTVKLVNINQIKPSNIGDTILGLKKEDRNISVFGILNGQDIPTHSVLRTTIGSNVTSIGDKTFQNCSILTSVTIPNSVTSIGEYAFNNCSITSINIPDSVTRIGQNAFEKCSNLQYVKLPNSINIIDNYTFENCTSLKTIKIPNSVTSIGDDAFDRCSSLTSVTIPSSVTSIGNSAFYGCLAVINLDYDAVKPVEYSFISNISNVRTVNIGDSVTRIDSGAFSGRTNLSSISIGNSITSIHNLTFSGCTSLSNVNLPNSVTTIGDKAFESCTSLKSIGEKGSGASVEIPDSVTSIGTDAFHGCTSLSSITIPNSVTSIGGSAFQNCKSATSVTIGDGVTSIGSNAFKYCSAVTYLDYEAQSILTTSITQNMTNIETVVIGDKVPSIGDTVFYNCSGLTSVTIGNSVTSIGGSAFRDCKRLHTITIPDSVITLGYGAFSGCSNLNSVEIGNSLGIIGSNAFNSCTYLNRVNSDIDGVFNIPNNVTDIGSYAFISCKGVTTLTIPDSVINIGEKAFQSCSNIISLVIPDSVTSIGADAFSYCTSTKNLEFDAPLTIKPSIIGEMKNLETVVIGDKVPSIGRSVFSACTKITSVFIGKSVTSIEISAFESCRSLTSITYNGTITQWNAISKGNYWKNNVPTTCIVHCTDGDISI